MRRGGPPILPIDPAAVPPFSREEGGTVIYKLVGKAVVKFVLVSVRRRYATQLRFGLGFGVAALAIGAYLASREVAEG